MGVETRRRNMLVGKSQKGARRIGSRREQRNYKQKRKPKFTKKSKDERKRVTSLVMTTMKEQLRMIFQE